MTENKFKMMVMVLVILVISLCETIRHSLTGQLLSAEIYQIFLLKQSFRKMFLVSTIIVAHFNIAGGFLNFLVEIV